MGDFSNDSVITRVDSWCEFFGNQYRVYRNGYSYISNIMKEMIYDQLCPKLINLEGKELFNIYQEYQNIMEAYNQNILECTPNMDEIEQRIFDLQLCVVQRFQKRESLKDLSRILLDKGTIINAHTESVRFETIITENYIDGIDGMNSLDKKIKYAIESLYHYREYEGFTNANARMWFRGIANKNYPIIPSGMVHFGENVKSMCKMQKYEENSFAMTECHSYERFRYSADGAPEIINPSNYTMIDYMALMQHYGDSTNLVDWSEDVYASAYFALEDEVNANGSYRKGKDDSLYSHEKDDAAIYILDPLRFNIACEEIEKQIGLSDNCVYAEDIPNISIGINQKTFSDYCDPYSVINKQKKKETWIWSKKHTIYPIGLDNDIMGQLKEYFNSYDKSITSFLPRAVFTSKLNPRIKAQSGLFMMYNLNSPPILPAHKKGEEICDITDNMFKYQSIEEIQKYYLKMKGGTGYPFLITLVIPSYLKKSLGEFINKNGIFKERIYPELQNRQKR